VKNLVKRFGVMVGGLLGLVPNSGMLFSMVDLVMLRLSGSIKIEGMVL